VTITKRGAATEARLSVPPDAMRTPSMKLGKIRR